MIKLAEAYIHFSIDVKDVPPSDLRAFEEEIYARYALILNEFRGNRVLTVRVEDGSLKIWITVLGTLYTLIIGYGAFRQGIDYLVSDAKKFDNMVISDLVESVNIPQEKVYRIERRLGMPGKIQRILVRVERLSQLSSTYQNPDIADEVEHIKGEIINILKAIPDEQDRQIFIEALPKPISSSLPMPLPTPIDIDRVAVIGEPFRQTRRELEMTDKKERRFFLKSR
jgi:hypothetical protein